ncbi:MAG: YybH family protein [Gemmatimonadota bacterium]
MKGSIRRLVGAWLLVACGMIVPACNREPSEPAIPVTQYEAELIEVDREFARSMAEGGLDAWVEHFAPEGAMISGQGEITGEPYIRAAMAPVLTDSTVVFTWTPQRARVAESGELGYTVGDYRISRRDSMDQVAETLDRGKYVSIWRRQPDGTWKVVVDIGNSALE